MTEHLLEGVEAFIFDLGGVIINLETHRTFQAFVQASVLPAEEVLAITKRPEFAQFERGELKAIEFRNFIRHVMRTALTDAELDAAWNAMILDIPPARLNLLKELGKHRPVFILSNTNEIHLNFVNHSTLAAHKLNNFAELVHKDYYSHLLGMRKPEPEIFQHLLDAHKLNPATTLLLDDNEENILAAKKLGLKTYHVPVNQLDLNLF